MSLFNYISLMTKKVNKKIYLIKNFLDMTNRYKTIREILKKLQMNMTSVKNILFNY